MKKGLFFLAMAALFLGLTSSVRSSKQDSETGIVFEHLSLQQAKRKAKKTGKLIFIDVYTVWCGPCKQMKRHTFTDPRVAKLFNEKFINIEIEAERDADGPEVSRRYRISGYPTLLFIDAEGNVKKYLSGKQSPEQLLAYAKNL